MACTRKRHKVLGTLRNQLSSVNTQLSMKVKQLVLSFGQGIHMSKKAGQSHKLVLHGT